MDEWEESKNDGHNEGAAEAAEAEKDWGKRKAGQRKTLVLDMHLRVRISIVIDG